ncbi:MAG: serine/threonine-protein kinase, partial [Bryobacterales bacterium]|nr:serine/threonine-protein kinase [Bryobacterales bacterium]
MDAMVGQTIGHYRLLDKLGEGGMGVVFRAQDMRLGRCVAVKVLPPDKVADPARKARFVQEARAASALNHLNIIQIYDIDQSDGVDFIVMEYVPGRTLDQVMGRKGLSLAGALTYAVQIARALAAAHAAGIVHRDLKPANVMFTNEGVVKLLDFGLAKLTGPAETGEFDSTETQKADTGEGVLLGTVAYMSPEQAEGKEIDARSDIFSFGSLLYEMVTGRRAFQGETRASTLAAVLREEPKPVSHWAPGMPREAERLIRRCLRKNPAHRFQHMDDLKVALEELKEESDSGQLQSEALPPRARRRIGLWIGLAAGLVLAAIAAVKWNRLLTSRPAPEPAFTRLTFDAGLSTDPAVSPDGKLLAYASDRGGGGNLELWVKHLGGGEPIRLTRGAEDILEPRFSPDGATIAFRWERDGGGIYTISSLGGEPRLIAKHGRRPVFSPDGRSIAYWVGENLVGGRIFVVAAHGGEPLAVQ